MKDKFLISKHDLDLAMSACLLASDYMIKIDKKVFTAKGISVKDIPKRHELWTTVRDRILKQIEEQSTKTND